MGGGKRVLKRFVASPPDGGEDFVGEGLRAFCDEHGLSYDACRKLCSGKGKTHKGWRFRWLEGVVDGVEDVVEPAYAALGEVVVDVVADDVEDEPVKKGSRRYHKRRLQKLHERLSDLTVYYLENPDEIPKGWNPTQLASSLKMEAEVHQIDWSGLADDRDPLEKASDRFMEMQTSVGRMFEATDTELDAIIVGIEEATRRGIKQFEKYDSMKAKDLVKKGTVPDGEDPEGPPGPKTIAEAGRQWLDRFRKIQEIRRSILDPAPTGMSRKERIVYNSTRLLRFMLFVSRSDVGGAKSKARGDVYLIGDIHVEMSMSIWLARNGYTTSKWGLIGPGDLVGYPGNKFEFAGVNYAGVMLLYPPRHGKTNIIAADIASEMNFEHRRQAAYLHRSEGMTAKQVGKVASFFDLTRSSGRRNASLYPYSLDKGGNNETSIRLRNDERTTNPNLIGVGVNSRGQGHNLNTIYIDDVTHRDDQTQPTVREGVKDRVGSTWTSRLQGDDGGFMVVSGYPWHHEDVLWTYYQKALLAGRTNGRQGLVLWVAKRAVGGPKDGFKPIWPEMYDAAWLKRAYVLLGDDAAWLATNCLNPISDGNRIVRELRLYNVHSEETKAFIRNGVEQYVSCDPTAKGDGTGDKVGWVQAMLGQVRTIVEVDGVRKVEYEDQIRITSQDEFPATQMDLSDKIAELAEGEPTDEVFMEVVTGLGSATIEMLERMHGIRGVTECGHRGKDKEQRLRSVSQMLENSNPMLPACVLFPGKVVFDEDGNPTDRLEPIDEIKPLVNYVINFRVASGYHSLDALTQMLHQCRGRLKVAGGKVSRELAVNKVEKTRARALIDRMMKKNRERKSRQFAANGYNSTGF